MEDISLECHRSLMHFSWKIMRRSRKNLAQIGLAWNQYAVLRSLEPGDGMTLSQISSKCFKENSNVTALVDFLQEKGWAKRVHDAHDRRSIRVVLTDEGVIMREKIIKNHHQFIKALYLDIDLKEMEIFLEMLRKFEKQMM